MKRFIGEERGHDKMLDKALDSMSGQRQEEIVFPETKKLMEVFERTAEENYLGFCFCVDIFEKPTYSEKHPLADRLKESGCDTAAQLIQKHADINQDGGHDQMALELLEKVGGATYAVASDALLRTQQLSDIGFRISERLMECR